MSTCRYENCHHNHPELPERGTAATEDGRRLAAIRDVLARFDWEHDDRQYALEQIERIATGEQP